MVFFQRRLRATATLALIIIILFYYTLSASDDLSGEKWSSDQKGSKTDPKQHWKKLPDKHPVVSLRALPSGKPVSIPTIQAKPPVENESEKTERLKRLAAVKESFVHSWEGYKAHAWLRDEVTPVSGSYRDTFGGWAATLVDSLDSLWILGMKEDFEIAVNAVHEIDFTTTEATDINVFETTIRYMGGFLASYDISGGKYPVLLEKAKEVGDFLMSAFDTPNRFPITRWPWKRYIAGDEQAAPASVIVSELGSLSLEFTRLSQLTGDNKYYDAIQRISDAFEESQNKTRLPGMWPIVVDAAGPSFSSDNKFTLGGMSDSLYEYLPKQYLMVGGLLEQPRKLYEVFIEAAHKYMFFPVLNPKNLDIMISGDAQVMADGTILRDPKGQHLTCFAGGMVGIAAKIFNRPAELKVAQALTDGCVWAYDSSPHGVTPEIFSVIPCDEENACKWTDERWYKGISGLNLQDGAEALRQGVAERRLAPGFTGYDSRKYILRPEAIESVFIMYRITGDIEWQNKAWRMFKAIEKVSRTDVAASAVADVTISVPQMTDSMESFWLAETLKYFYLVFSDFDTISLDEYVLNTEAHPLKRPS